MEVLGLDTNHPGRLPASSFPEIADVYFCDKCGRDITKHLHRGRAHVDKPFGPPIYECDCGEKYRSGTVKWDQLGIGAKRRQLALFRLEAIFSVPIILTCIAIYLRFYSHSKLLLIIAAIAIIPSIMFSIFSVLGLLEAIAIVRSIWRTRLLHPIAKNRSQ